jgi:hypothetical protein
MVGTPHEPPPAPLPPPTSEPSLDNLLSQRNTKEKRRRSVASLVVDPSTAVPNQTGLSIIGPQQNGQ